MSSSRVSGYRYEKDLVHTPEGVRDIYGNECEKKFQVQEKIRNICNQYGFHDIQTPSFEFFDVFGKERGTATTQEMYKFFDRDNNTLVLRPDMTPAVARCVAKYYKDEDMQIRLCYTGNTFVNTVSHQGKLNEVTQIGAELVNDDTSDADAEMVALTVACLLESGLKDFQVTVGHSDIFRGLVEEAGLEEEEVKKARLLFERRNFFGVEDMLKPHDIDAALYEIFEKLPELFGDVECLRFVKERTKSQKVLKAVDRLEKLVDLIQAYGFAGYITLDLSMVSKYDYYTGIVFKAYTYGTGEAIAAGGRYDRLIEQYGKTAAAIGCVIIIDQLMMALQRQHLVAEDIRKTTVMLYLPQERMHAVRMADTWRKNGIVVQLMRKSSRRSLEEYLAYARRMDAAELVFVEKEEAVTLIFVKDDRRQSVPAGDAMGMVLSRGQENVNGKPFTRE